MNPPVELQRMAGGAVFFVVDRLHGFSGMAIRALQLHRAIGSAQFCLQMHAMTELDGTGLGKTRPEHCKFRMAAIETSDIRIKSRCSSFGLKIRMALRTCAIAGARQTKRTLMLDMAVRAGRSKNLIRVMHRTRMAR